MRIIRSNRTERLVDALVTDLARDPLAPKQKETIVVQSHEMRRWLPLQIAKSTGVCANTTFLFPREALETCLETVETAPAGNDRFSRGALQWRTATELGRMEGVPTSIGDRLSNEAKGDVLVELAAHLARAYEWRLTYRPRDILKWEQGGTNAWHAALWQRVREGMGGRHVAASAHSLPTTIDERLRQLGVDTVTDGAEHADGLPPRLSLFALQTLPPLYLHVFSEVARLVPTTLYLLRPTPHYWGDEKTQRRHARSSEPLLATCGQTANEFDEVLLNATMNVAEEHELFDGESGVLPTSLLQPGAVEVHACPTRLREVQALHDAVRTALEQDPSLEPSDILIASIDTELYRPLIDATFGDHDAPAIPFYFGHPRTLAADPWVSDFMRLATTVGSRWPRREILDLLTLQSIADPFRLEDDAIEHLRSVVESAGVQWGIDGAHRRALGFPDDDLKCWRRGLERLLLGYVLHPEEARTFIQAYPVHRSTQSSADAVATLANFVETYANFWQAPGLQRTVQQWMRWCQQLAESLLTVNASAVAAFRACTDAIARNADDAGFDTPLTQTAALNVVAKALENQRFSTPHDGAGITVWDMSVFHAVPFRMVCLLGMGASDFPRRRHPPVFDFASPPRQPGDRDRRTDDLHAFLSHATSARDRLIVTYSADVGSPEPSIAVTSLLDTVGDAAAVHQHALHPFEPDYFIKGTQTQSYSTETRDVARALCRASANKPAVADSLLETTLVRVSARALAATLWHPVRTFYRDRLGVYLKQSARQEPEDHLVSHLDVWRLGTGYLDRAQNVGIDEARAWLTANPFFPSGVPGTRLRRTVQAEAEQLLAADETTPRASPVAQTFRVSVDGVEIVAEVDGVNAAKRTVASFSRQGRAAELRAWVEHLVVNTVTPLHTILLSRHHEGAPSMVQFDPTDTAKEQLAPIVALYRHAMSSPVPMFPGASHEFAARVEAGEPTDVALERANTKFFAQMGDHKDPYVHRAYSETHPFNDDALAHEFERLARTLLVPWLQGRETA